MAQRSSFPPVHLTMEANLASAHRRIWYAADVAESLRDQGLADDLHSIRLELERIQRDLLRGRGRSTKSRGNRT